MRLLFIKFLIIFFSLTVSFNILFAKEYKYDVRAYNLNIMQIDFKIDDEVNNTINFHAESVGIVGFFVKVFASAQDTFDKNKDTWNYVYRYDKPTTNKYRINKVLFSKEKVLSFETDPPRLDDITKKVPRKSQDYFGAIDPIYAVKKLFLNDKNNFNCNKKIKTFDGNTFYYLIMIKQNDELDFHSTFSPYKGKLQKCSLIYVPISGYIPDDPNLPAQFKVDVYFGIVGDNYFPIYATTRGKKGIRLKMYLNEVN